MTHPILPVQDSHIAFMGRTGSGKTVAAKGAVEQLLRHGRRVVVLDPQGHWWGLRARPDGAPSGLRVGILGGAHGDYPLDPKMGERLGEIVAGRNVPLVLDLSEMRKGAQRAFVATFLETLFRLNREPLHVVMDEAHLFVPQSGSGDVARCVGAVEDIVMRGRSKGLFAWLVTPRPAVINKNATSMVGTLVVMHMAGAHDRKAIEQWVTGDADKDQVAAVTQSLPGLRTGEAWIWTPQDGQLARAEFPMIETYDSSRTPKVGEKPLPPVTLDALDIDALRKALGGEAAAADPVAEAGKAYRAGAAAGSMIAELQAEVDRLTAEVGVLRAVGARAWADGRRVGISIGIARAREAVNHLRIDEITEADPASPVPPAAAEDVSAKPAASARRAPAAPRRAREDRELNAAAVAMAEILKALAPDGYSWAELAILTGRKPNSGYMRSARNQLLQQDLAEPSGDQMVATERLCEREDIALGHIPSWAEIIDRWAGPLKGPGVEIVRYVASNPGTTREEIGKAQGRSHSSGHFRSGVKDAVAAGLIEDRGGRLWPHPLVRDDEETGR